MKKIYGALLVLCLALMVSCGNIGSRISNDLAVNTHNTIASNSSISAQTPDKLQDAVVSNSAISNQTPDVLPEESNSSNKWIDMIYGKWEILDMVGYGYIYGDVSLEDYTRGKITIGKQCFEYDLPAAKGKVKNPRYKLTKQSKDDFWEYTHANAENGFGFKGNHIKMIEVFDGDESWDDFGRFFWIRDKKHLIFMGPVYFLAEKIE